MNIYNININSINIIDKPLVCCIGYFDGLHLGHQTLIKETNILANKLNIESALITFNPDPWLITKQINNDIKHINDYAIKLELLNKFNINNLIIIEFNEELSKLKSNEFINMLYKNIDIKGLIYGFDFKYGYKGLGNNNTIINEIKDNTILKEIQSINYDNLKISSTRIEQLIINGEIDNANKLLGYNYYIKGNVIKGNAKGRTIGFPTANIKYSNKQIIPKKGVYIGYAKYNNILYKSIINVGNNPTFNYNNNISIEANILEFNQDIYNEYIDIIFIKYIREEIKFNNKELLIKQLIEDKNKAIQLLND